MIEKLPGKMAVKDHLSFGNESKICVCVCVFLPVFDVIVFLLAFAFSIMHAVYGSKLTL